MRIHVVGAGALGGLYGALLARSGAEVRMLMRSDYDVVRRRGLRVRSVWGDFVLDPAPVYDDPAAMGPADCVLVGLKTTANDQYERLIGPSMGPASWICTLQNGLDNERRLAELFGPERVAGGVAFLCSSRTAPGEIEHSNYGAIEIGEFGRGVSERLRALGGLFERAGVPTTLSPDLRLTRWRKQIWNVPFNAISALTGASDTEAIVNDPELRALAWRVMREVQAVAAAEGAVIDDDFLTGRMEHTDTMGPYLTSMAWDYLERRPMEVEAIVGSVVRAGRRNGTPTPAVETIYALLARLDRRRRSDGRDGP